MPLWLSRRSFLAASAAAVVARAVAVPLPARAAAGTVVTVDASAPVAAPATGSLQMGTSAAVSSPSGQTLTVNSQYLSLNGTPWLPVSGEFHYSRVPSSQWETELRKMKAAGVQIITSYVIWIHHEEVQGQYVFTGDCDVQNFVTLCGQLGLRVLLRIGPWVHAEVRNGGLPDWVLTQSTPRSNNTAYLGFVTSFWTQLANRVSSLVWKAGGPVIGVQLENEYSGSASHIATLKSMAGSLGLDVPLYTVTAWNGANYPALQVLPVFGGYQDAPWDTIVTASAPNETYSFRFFSRENGQDGYPDKANGGAVPNPQSQLSPSYPFLTAEYGCGAAAMYRRRVVLNLPDDVAATIPVQLGSGVNLYGHYMFHGGRNPLGSTETLQESTASNSFNDLPIINYDYQAALGQFGEQRPTLGRIKLYHYFLNAFGSALAPMSYRQPSVIAGGSADLSSLRWSARSNGSSGFVFVNNHVRQYAMASHPGIQFQVKFANETVTFPSSGVTIDDGAYFIWPLNFALADARLSYASAQPVTSLTAFGRHLYVFVAQNGITPEFAFTGSTVSRVQASTGQVSTDSAGRTVVTGLTPGTDIAMQVTTASGAKVDVLVLTQAQADQLWRLTVNGTDVLLLTAHQFNATAGGFTFASLGTPQFEFGTYPDLTVTASGASTFAPAGADGVFTRYTGTVAAQQITVSPTQTRTPGLAPAVLKGGQAKGALEPTEAVISATQGEWSLAVPWSQVTGATDTYLTINYAGDLARIYSGDLLLDDHFYDGQPWSVSLKQLAQQADLTAPLTLAVMPLRSDAPIYLQPGAAPTYGSNGQACALNGLAVAPLYELDVTAAVPTFPVNGVYELICGAGGEVLDNGSSTAKGAPVVQWAANGGKQQHWTLTNIEAGYYSLVCAYSGMALDNNGSTTSGSAVVQHTNNGLPAQHWTIVDLGNGFSQLISRFSGMALDNGGASGNGAAIVQKVPATVAAQQWKLVKVG